MENEAQYTKSTIDIAFVFNRKSTNFAKTDVSTEEMVCNHLWYSIYKEKLEGKKEEEKKENVTGDLICFGILNANLIFHTFSYRLRSKNRKWRKKNRPKGRI